MSTPLEIEEKALGRWPRRLLHVPTMTSYEWQPGNVYGPATSPLYNAISYTWGRWRVTADADDESPADDVVTPLVVHGIPWDVPRVRPHHFTSEQLLHAIRRSTGLGIHPSPVDFLWIDIACIDQRGDEPKSAAEVGRQALIFEGARHVYAWLSVSDQGLRSTMREMIRMAKHVRRAYERVRLGMVNLPWDIAYDWIRLGMVVGVGNGSVAKLLRDPWFSSLWTLQEAFMRQDAIFLSREGTPATAPAIKVDGDWPQKKGATPDDSRNKPLILQRLVQYYREAYSLLELKSVPPKHSSVLRLLQQCGLSLLEWRHPLAIFIASGSRTCERDEDRVYGIQQVFRFRVGKSALSHRQGSRYTLQELQVQFGEQLLRQYGLQSQLHSFTQPAPIGRGWLPNSSSILPDQIWSIESTYSSISKYSVTQPQVPSVLACLLSVQNVNGNAWGKFDGAMCAFHRLHASCREAEETFTKSHRGYIVHTMLKIYLDRTDVFSSTIITPQCPSKMGEVPDLPQQALATKLSLEWSDSLYVLLLGRTQYTSHKELAGLLLLRCSDPDAFQYYRRIGLCTWQPSGWGITTMSDPIPEDSRFTGYGDDWQRTEGFFG